MVFMRRTKLTVTHPEVTKDSLRKALSMQKNARFGFRIAILQDVLNGKSITDISNERDVARSAVYDVVDRVNETGIEGLFDATKTGRPPKLTTDQIEELKRVLKESPKKYGYTQPRWDGPLLKKYIEEKYNVRYSVRHVQKLMKKMGYSLQRRR